MRDIASDRMPVSPAPRGGTYLTGENGLLSWFGTTDHKRIALLYAAALTFFFIGGVAGVPIRLELFTPPADLLSADGYNRTFTLHRVLMVRFFLIPSIPNFLLPLMIGARDLAFPCFNLLSWYLFVGAGLLLVFALVAAGVDTGWTFHTPFSASYFNSYVMVAALAALYWHLVDVVSVFLYPLLRLAACAALLWIGFVFALIFADQQTRPSQAEAGTVTPDSRAPLATGGRLF